MKILSIFMLCLVSLFNQGIEALVVDPLQITKLHASCHQSQSCCENHLGSSGLATSMPELWYDVTAPNYPEAALISKKRNSGFRQGGVRLQATGLKILKSGNYWVSFKATLQNPIANAGAVVSVILAFNLKTAIKMLSKCKILIQSDL